MKVLDSLPYFKGSPYCRRVHSDFMLRGWFDRSCIKVPHIATLMRKERMEGGE